MNIKKSLPRLLYLDMKDWIELAKVYYGKVTNGDLFQILNKIINLTKEGKLRVVFNLTTYTELKKIRSENQRKKLSKFVFFLSKGYSFPPIVRLFEREILNYIDRILNIEEWDFRKNDVGIGLTYLMGATPTIVSDEMDKNDLDMVNEKLKEIISNPENLEPFLECYSPFISTKVDKYVLESYEVRQNIFRFQDKNLRKLAQDYYYFRYFLTPKIIKVTEKFNFNPKIILPASRFSTTNDIKRFLQEFPMMYCEHCLVEGRNLIRSYEIKYNDLFDIMGLAFPIAYFDYVVGEKFFITIARKSKLDRLYNTVLLTKLTELNEILDSI